MLVYNYFSKHRTGVALLDNGILGPCRWSGVIFLLFFSKILDFMLKLSPSKLVIQHFTVRVFHC